MSSATLKTFYRGTNESILTGCISVWYGSCTTYSCSAIQRVGRTSQKNCSCELPCMQAIYEKRCINRARRIIQDSSHPDNGLFQLQPSGMLILILVYIRCALTHFGKALSPVHFSVLDIIVLVKRARPTNFSLFVFLI